MRLDPAAQDLLFREARTCTEFTSEPVGDDQVRAIHDLVKYAPTSMNQQPMRVVLLRSPEARRELAVHLHPGNRPKAASAPLVALLAADLDFPETLPYLFPHRPRAGELFADPAVRRESALFNTALQVAYFIIGVRAAGLAAGPIVGYDADGVNKAFFGDGRREVVTAVAIGRPRGEPRHPRLPRLPFHDVVSTA
ncbi:MULTISPECIES: malonic semialdehyde reductase [Streptomyces]|uniref:malonic semialdehyde reductase n=1 Tax=Streptomyces TaxID=1883 RepID=UPI00163D15BB|nr:MULTISPECIES: malonic semialdehyde reductase [Streptomyces]MBC2876897.1 malonic semialdehyde reductase [Streptomyces sp. TYQ1024]UBI40973.1 malonic semialdehyde reductase [Streptomyces mobaraensis]UKW33454.1 malonic semialdehyde reductase [Streptomyces sp. TYQ1024]